MELFITLQIPWKNEARSKSELSLYIHERARERDKEHFLCGISHRGGLLAHLRSGIAHSSKPDSHLEVLLSTHRRLAEALDWEGRCQIA